jgi:hypothetical protein
MRKFTVAAIGTLGLLVALGAGSSAFATNSDYAEFDGTNPANQGGSGALCGAKAGGANGTVFTYHVSVSNFSDTTAILRLTHSDGVDETRYQIPGRTSFSMSHEGGKNPTNKAVRFSIEGNGQLAGEASITGPNVFCLSCDADANGAPACDALIPVGGTGPGPNN